MTRGYDDDMAKLTEKEAREREERLLAAGFIPRREKIAVITLLNATAPTEDPLEDDDGSGAVE